MADNLIASIWWVKIEGKKFFNRCVMESHLILNSMKDKTLLKVSGIGKMYQLLNLDN